LKDGPRGAARPIFFDADLSIAPTKTRPVTFILAGVELLKIARLGASERMLTVKRGALLETAQGQ
jgi:hypothetical protein